VNLEALHYRRSLPQHGWYSCAKMLIVTCVRSYVLIMSRLIRSQTRPTRRLGRLWWSICGH